MKVRAWLICAFVTILGVAALMMPKSLFCRHEYVNSVVVKPAICLEDGREDDVCADCGNVMDSRILSRVGHSFGEYEIVKYARGNRSGLEARVCAACQEVETREYYCLHKLKCIFTDFSPTCTETGLESTVCMQCRGDLEVREVEAWGHSFGEYELTVQPTADKNGVETRICAVCSLEEHREFVCPHKKVSSSVTKKATCLEEGECVYTCKLCKKVVEKEAISKTKCKYGKWVITNKATPDSEGKRYKKCSYCGEKKNDTYSFSMPGKNSIYIPGTGINHKFAITDFTQRDVDTHNIVYTTPVNDHGPIIMGHNTGTMGKLSKTKVGQYIYLSCNGSLEKYKVIASEYAVFNCAENDIVGQKTGWSIWDCLDCKTIHLYTCYGSGETGRWLVVAKQVG